MEYQERDDGSDAYADRILDAARELFVRHGLRRTSLAQIAGEAGVAPATLYRRFGNRDALVVALLVREADRLFAEVTGIGESADDAPEALVQSFLAFVRGLRDHDLLQELIALDPDLVLPLLTTEGAGFLSIGRDFLASQLNRARAHGVALNADPEVLAEIFMRVAHSLVLTRESVLPVNDESALAVLARDTFARLAFAPERGQ